VLLATSMRYIQMEVFFEEKTNYIFEKKSSYVCETSTKLIYAQVNSIFPTSSKSFLLELLVVINGKLPI
jgi:hypothetical protein